MATIKTRGLIIKQTAFSESNRIITIFTHEYGIIKAAVYGASNTRSKNAASTQFLCYGDFVLYKSGKDLLTVKSCEIVESFFTLREDIVKLSLCVYMCDVVYALLNTDSPDENILKLILNCIYALSNKDIPCETVRTVFELKAICLAGYMPNLSFCKLCKTTKDICAFSKKGDGILCDKCKRIDDIFIDGDIYHAIFYILNSPIKKMFSFNASDEVMKTVAKISSVCIRAYTEKEFSSLKYYEDISKTIKTDC